jgi:PAS domain S-box-containing protein
MDTAIHVLIVADPENDTAPVLSHLERAGFVPFHQRVSTAAAMRAALQNADWDIIISDYNTAQFDAVAALRTLQDCGHDTPFIVVADALEEDAAMAMIQTGVPNLVMKDHPTSLILAVHRELGLVEVRRKCRQTEEALRQSEERFRALYEDNPTMYFTLDAEARVLSVNRFGAEQLGYRVDELVGQPVLTIFHPDDIEAVRQQFALCLQNPMQVAHWEFRKVRKDGSVLWVKEAARALHGVDGNPVVLVVCEDISERKLTEKKLRESAERYRTILESIEDSYVESDLSGKLTSFNPSACRMLGYSPNELQGKHYRELMDEETGRRIKRIFELAFQTGKAVKVPEYQLIRKDGTKIITETSVVVAKDAEGNPIGFCSIGRDRTSYKRTQQDLLKERERLATVLDGTPIPTFMIDQDHRVVFWNRALEIFISIPREVALGKTLGESLRAAYMGKSPPILADLILDMSDEELLERYGHKIRRAGPGEAFEVTTSLWPKGEKRTLDVLATRIHDHQGAVVGAIQSAQDVTEKRQLQKQLYHTQKMKAIGTLASGIAHDFNNILTAIMGYTHMALAKSAGDAPTRRYLGQVLEAGSRATELVKQILTFGRQAEQEQQPVQMAPIVQEVLKLLRSSLPTTIEIRQDITVTPDESVVLADPTQIHQVLMNLCTNAAQAMHPTGGILGVSLTELQVDAALVSHYPDLNPGPHLRLAVSDTGHGMDAAVMERVFDPYFTTKGLGEGTGLGLAVVQGIVKRHGGVITVYSEPDRGTTFQVFLAKIEERILSDVEPVEELPAGSERILFVDDEQSLVELGAEILESLGYRVVPRTSSLEALQTFRAQPDAFDLVITDMTMPGITGSELAKEVLAIRPDMPIILCTGFSELMDEKQAEEAGIRKYVLKPYVVTNLATAIRDALGDK